MDIAFIGVKKLYDDAQLPLSADSESIGSDLYVHHVEDGDGIVKVFTGIAIEPPSNCWVMLAARSSAYKSGLVLSNGVGVIDPGYRGEIIGVFTKTAMYRELPVKGDRLLQIVPIHAIGSKFEEVDDLSKTRRGAGGFGSTGR